MRRAVSLRERQEAPRHRMTRQMEQREQVARAIRERRAGERMNDHIRARGIHDLATDLAALAAVVLEVVRLIEHDSLPRQLRERTFLAGEEVVVYDDPPG